MMGSNQTKMIRNILERGCPHITLDKVVTRREGGSYEVCDKPDQVKARVQQHFQQWTAHWNLGVMEGQWESVYTSWEDVGDE